MKKYLKLILCLFVFCAFQNVSALPANDAFLDDNLYNYTHHSYIMHKIKSLL